MSADRNSGVLIVYDGDCPVCRSYVKGLRLKEASGQITLQSARENTAEVRSLVGQGYDLNQGMVVVIGEVVFYGADAMHTLSMMTTASGLFNRFTYILFKSKAASRWLYPVFRNLRLLLLKIIGVKPIEGHTVNDSTRAPSEN